MYNAAIIGISGFGDIHYNDLKNETEKGNVKVIAATVINQDEEAEKCAWLKAQGTKLYTDWQQMLEDQKGKIDICFIPTGISFHAPMSIAAMKAGANVFVEKPVAATIQEVNQMKAVAAETGKFVAVGYQFIYQPDSAKVKELLLDDKIGKIKSLKCMGLWSRDSIYYNRNNWAGKLKSNDEWVLDSPYNNALAHFLNLMCFLAGTKFEESAELKKITAELYHAHPIESADTACIKATTQQDAQILFYVTHACVENESPVVIITGEKGIIEWNFADSEIVVKLNDGSEERFSQTPNSDYRNNIMSALAARLKTPEAFICSLQIGGTQTLCINGAHESSPVNKLEKQYYEVVEESDRTKVKIHDIATIVKQAFDFEKMYSEFDISWAKPGEEISLEGYDHFDGGKIK